MKRLFTIAALCLIVAAGCKKKEETAPAAGSGSATATGSGSAAATGSGSAAGSAAATGSGSAAATGSGSAAGSGSATAAGSGSATGVPAQDAVRNWDCKKLCKLAVQCKSKEFHSEKECNHDCTGVMKDTTGKFENASIEGGPYYSCVNKATNCAAFKKCEPPK